MAAASGRGGGGAAAAGGCQPRGSDAGGNTGSMHLATTAEDEEADSDSGDGGVRIPRTGHDLGGVHERAATAAAPAQRADAGADQVATILHRASGSTSFTSPRLSRPSVTAARSRRSQSGDDPLAVALGIMRSASSETSRSFNKRGFEAATVTAERRRTSLARRSRSGGSGGGPPPPGTPPVLTHDPSPPRSRSGSKSRERRASCNAVLYSQTSSQVAELQALQALVGQQSIDIPGRCRSFGGGDGKATASSGNNGRAPAEGARLQGMAQPAAAAASSLRQQQQQGEQGDAVMPSCEARDSGEGAEAACSEDEVVAQRRQAWLLGSCMKISRSHRRRTRSCDLVDEEQDAGVVAAAGHQQHQQQREQSCPLPGLSSGSASVESSSCASQGREAAGRAVPITLQFSGPPSPSQPQPLLLPASEPGCVYGDASTRAEHPNKQQSATLSADGIWVGGDANPTAAAAPATAVTGQPGAVSGACPTDHAVAVSKPDDVARHSGPSDALDRDRDGLADSSSADSEDERDAEIASVAASAVAEWRASRAASLASLASREASSTGSNLLDSADDQHCSAAATDAFDAAIASAGADNGSAAGACGGMSRCQGPGRQSTHRLSWAGHAVNVGSDSGKQAWLQADASGAASPAAGIHDGQSASVAAVGRDAAAADEAEAPAQRLTSSRSRRCSIAGEVVAGVQEPGDSGRSIAGATSVRWQQSRSLRPARSILKKSSSHAPREAHVSMHVRDDAESADASALPGGAADGAAATPAATAEGDTAQLTGQRQPMPDPGMPPPADADQEQQVEGEQEQADAVMGYVALPDPGDGIPVMQSSNASNAIQHAEHLPVGADSEPFGRPPSRRNSRSPGPGDQPSIVLHQGRVSAAVSPRRGSSAQAEQPARLGTAVGAEAATTGAALCGRAPSNPSRGAPGTVSPSGLAAEPAHGRDSLVSSCCSQLQAGLQRCGSGSSSVASHPFMAAVDQATRAATARTSLCETNSHVAMSSGAMSDGRPWAAGYDYEGYEQEGLEGLEG
ncbi:hypothetical protein HXX76_006534 [Chlamydomonas incerta]|uniref:Uncharacterized protein n=1 Tax=Chlamydomonas incerta TaxID=51695 RepID=A0A835SZT6_CHLIN|nr:hypothetical protein HXX76_006534 [Chlamydomonas incerta]|eukprot:KAG2436223.1 hypothetical protein HXX76_006534 [Chlamydomonas incerta]